MKMKNNFFQKKIENLSLKTPIGVTGLDPYLVINNRLLCNLYFKVVPIGDPITSDFYTSSFTKVSYICIY
jgi:hypothetical protein